MRFRTVLFDLDGTVVDSAAMILASMRHAAEVVLQRRVPDAELMAGVGGPGLREQMRALDADRHDDLVRVYRKHNEALHADLSCCHGVLPVLQTLRREGRQLGVVTTKRRKTVTLAFDVLPFGDYFDAVVTADDTSRHKPRPDPLLVALERLDSGADEAAYVGDSPFDVRAARAASVFSVAVTWGGIHSEERLAAEEPDALVRAPEELLGVL